MKDRLQLMISEGKFPFRPDRKRHDKNNPINSLFSLIYDTFWTLNNIFLKKSPSKTEFPRNTMFQLIT